MSLPYMPFYIGDYLKDTQHLEAEEHGAYVLLLFAMWNNDGWLPLDEEKLRRIARVKPERWPDIWNVLLEFFSVTRMGIEHGRISVELSKAKELHAKRANAGRKGGIKAGYSRAKAGLRMSFLGNNKCPDKTDTCQAGLKPGSSRSESERIFKSGDVERGAVENVITLRPTTDSER